MINISEVVRNWFAINCDYTCTMFNINFSLSAFSFSMSVILFSFIHFRLFDSFQETCSFFKREVIELSLWINSHILKIILENHMFVFCENIKHLTFRVTIKVEWNSIQWKFSSGTWGNMQQFCFWNSLLWKVFFWIKIWSKNFFNVKVIPNQWVFSKSLFFNGIFFSSLLSLFLIFVRKFRFQSNLNLTQSNVDFVVNILQIRSN